MYLDNQPSQLGLRLLRKACTPSLPSALVARTVECIADIRASAEGKEGVQAFLNKRKPNWLG